MSNTAIGGPWSIRPCAYLLLRRLPTIRPSRQAASRRGLQRLAAARQAWIGHEVLVRVERLLAVGGLDTRGRTVGQERPALFVVLEVGDHDLLEHLLVYGRIVDRAQRLDSAVEVARHHVGGGDVDRRLGVRQAVAGAEAVDAAVLEEAADDRLDADVLRQPGHAGPQAADAAHHEVDL